MKWIKLEFSWILCFIVIFLSCASLNANANGKDTIVIPKAMRDGSMVDVWYRKGLLPEDQKARGFPLKHETLLLKAGTLRREGAMPLKCDILFERDVPVSLRDGTVIYVDIFRPDDSEKHPAIMAWSPYGKEIGGQHLDDVKGRSGVPLSATSGLEKFEAPDPAYWVSHGYVIINPDSRGAHNSNGNLNYWGTENSLDGYDQKFSVQAPDFRHGDKPSICYNKKMVGASTNGGDEVRPGNPAFVVDTRIPRLQSWGVCQTIEWAAKQSWSNGKIGMSGNSWLTVSQWFIAGECPPHLTAIAPWEGFYDHFRETANRGGGIPNPAFPEAIFETFASRNWIEDQPRMVVTHILMDSY